MFINWLAVAAYGCNDDVDDNAEPLGRWPQGKAMKASVATPMRNEHWFATKKTLVFPRSAACSL